MLGVVHTHPGSLRHPSDGDFRGDIQWVGQLRGGEGVFGIGTADGKYARPADELWQPRPNMHSLGELGFTWYSLIDQVDWDTALRETNGTVNPLGLFDLDRKIRPVGEAYHKLMMDWQYILPTSSVCLRTFCP